MAITYVSNFGLPAQCTRLTDLGSRMSVLFSHKPSILWQFLQRAEQRQACQFVEYIIPIFCPFLSRSEGKLMLDAVSVLRDVKAGRNLAICRTERAVVELGSI